MGMRDKVRMARAADRLFVEFRRLHDHPGAYRPADAGDMPPQLHDAGMAVPDAGVALHRLSDHGRRLGLTAGDVGVLAVELLSSIDEYRSYPDAFDTVVAYVTSGQLLAVNGQPLRRFTTPQAVAQMCELIAVASRFEAYREGAADLAAPVSDPDVAPQADADHGERVRRLRAEYARLAADVARLPEVRRLEQVRAQLADLGQDPPDLT